MLPLQDGRKSGRRSGSQLREDRSISPEKASARAFGNLSLTSAVRCNRYSTDLQQVQLGNLSSLPHLSSTIWLEPDRVSGRSIEWVNRTFWDMRSRGRWMMQQGLDAAAIMGDTCPALLSSTHEIDDAPVTEYWTVSRWATRFIQQFSHLSHSDKLACWIVMFVAFHVR